MKKTTSFGLALLLTAFTAGEAAAQSGATPPPAPAPGSPAVFLSGADLMSDLESAKAEGGPLAGTRIMSSDEYGGFIVHRNQPNSAIAHPGNSELHYIIEGSGTVVTGGTIVREDGTPARIEGGEAHRVVQGDIVIIPEGSPHMYSQVDEPITYLEWRWVAPE